jgi:ABC-type nickel/cobalt efflux system permease component RcnA
VVPPLQAHPLLNKFYERVVDVHLSADPAGQVVVEVRYQLEVNQLIALLDAKILLDQRKEEEPGKAKEYYAAFTRLHAPLLADRLYATVDNRPLEFSCAEKKERLNNKDGTLHCEFLFRAKIQAGSEEKHSFTFEEGAYKEEAGRVLLSLRADSPVVLLAKEEPSAELKARSPADLKIGDDERMRHASATFTLPAPTPAPAEPHSQVSAAETPPSSPGEPTEEKSETGSLLDLLFDTRTGLVLLLISAAGWGAVHALTPGHGKTLVAAYLVGEQGTLIHAVFLGLMVTLSHTGAVLAVAVLLYYYPQALGGTRLFLTFGGGLLVAGMGFWLLYRRVAGQADHFHLVGGHHHHHGPGEPHVHALPSGKDQLTWWNLVVLGVAGGIIPCTDAIVLLFAAIAKGYLTRALPILLAFSAGLAAVLIIVGMLVVTSKRFAGSHFGESRLFRALPILSALLIMGLGLWLCYDAVHGGIATTFKGHSLAVAFGATRIESRSSRRPESDH